MKKNSNRHFIEKSVQTKVDVFSLPLLEGYPNITVTFLALQPEISNSKQLAFEKTRERRLKI